ncbi:MAG: hypothetical protein IVW54_02820 [Candidatus Binataceae bacterium]|nr:hypothetical protein [Candidatus Binataceae bacterium]
MAAREEIERLVCGFPEAVRNRRPLVVLGAVDGYADDSSEKDGVYVLAGWVSNAPDWSQFSDAYEKAGLPRNFHMKTARRKRGRRVRKLAELTQKYATYRVDCVLHCGNYNNIVKGKIRPELDSPYFVLFYQVILATARLLDLLGSDDTVDWIFDEQGKIGLDANSWYWFIKENAPPNLKRRLGSSPIFRDDEDLLALKAADLFAWQIRRHIAYEQPKAEPLSNILYSFLGKYGVSGVMTGPYLTEFVQALNKGLLLKVDCSFFLPKGIAGRS